MMACVLVMVAMLVVCRMPEAIYTIMLMVSGKDTILNIAVGMIVVSIAIIMRGIVPAAVGMQPCLRAALCCANGITCGSRSAVM